MNISSTSTQDSITFNYSTSYLAKTSVVYGTDSSLESGTTTTPLETSFAQNGRSTTVPATCGVTYYFKILTIDAGGTTWESSIYSVTPSCGGGIVIFNGNAGGGNVTSSIGGSTNGDTGERSGVQNTLGCEAGFAFSPITGNACYDNKDPKINKPFMRILFYKMSGEDVLRLQKFLNSHGALVSAAGQPGSPNNETTYFGKATEGALAKYQKEHGITPAAGYFGDVTKAFVNKVLGF